MNPRENLLETYEKIIELKEKKIQAEKTVDNKPMRFLKKIYDFTKLISEDLKDVNTIRRKRRYETSDIKYQVPSDDSLDQLIDNAIEVFANVGSMGTLKNIDFEQFYQRLEEEQEDIKKMGKRMNRYVECSRKMNVIAGTLLYLKHKGLLDDSNEPLATLPGDTDTYGSCEAHKEVSKSDSMGASFEDKILSGSQSYAEEAKDENKLYYFPFKNSLNDSGASMELKYIVAEMYANIEKDEEEMKSFINRKVQFIKQLIYSEEIIADLQIARETVTAESTLSATGNVGTNKRTLCTCTLCLNIIKEFS